MKSEGTVTCELYAPEVPPAFPRIVMGFRDASTVITLDLLKSGGLGVAGSDAARWVRAVLARLDRSPVRLIIPRDDARCLKPEAEEHSGTNRLILVDDLETGILRAQVALADLVRQRQEGHEHESGDSTGVLLIATVGPAQNRVRGLLGFGSEFGVGGIVLGDWPYGLTIWPDSHGVIRNARGPDSRLLLDTDIGWRSLRQVERSLDHGWSAQPCCTDAQEPTPEPVLRSPEQMIAVAKTPAEISGMGGPAEGAWPDACVADQPPSEHSSLRINEFALPKPLVVVTGPLELSYEGRIYSGCLRQIATDVAAYVAWYPGESTSMQAASRIWPHHRRTTQSAYFHNGKDYLRQALRSLCPDMLGFDGRPPKFLASGAYQKWSFLSDQCDLDVRLILHALESAQSAANDGARLAALQEAATLWRGDYGVGCAGRWVTDIRATLDRKMLSALCEIADLTMSDDPEVALKALTRARRIEPLSEAAVSRSLQLLSRMGRISDAREIWNHYKDRLKSTAQVASPPTRKMAEEIFGSSEDWQ